MFFFFNVTATTEIYTYCHTLSLHDALPISAIIHYEEERATAYRHRWATFVQVYDPDRIDTPAEQVGNPNVREGQIFDKRSEEHTSELQSLMRNSYAVLCLTKKISTSKHVLR